MGKTGTIWQFFRALFPSTWRTLFPDALFTRIWTHTQTPRICHIFVLSLVVSRSTLPRNAYFSWQAASAKLPNRPGFALLQGATMQPRLVVGEGSLGAEGWRRRALQAARGARPTSVGARKPLNLK